MFTFYTHRKNTQHIMLSEKCILLTKNDLQMNYSHKFARHSHILESGERKPVRLNQFLSFVKMFHTFCIHIIHLNSFSHSHSFSLSFSLSLSLPLSLCPSSYSQCCQEITGRRLCCVDKRSFSLLRHPFFTQPPPIC